MLAITLFRLGSSSSLMLSYVIVTSSSYPPLPLILSEQVCSSSSSKPSTDDLKIVLNFFLGGEIRSLGLNLSLGVSNFMRIFS